MSHLSNDHRTVGEHYDGPAHDDELTRLEQQSPVERAMMVTRTPERSWRCWPSWSGIPHVCFVHSSNVMA